MIGRFLNGMELYLQQRTALAEYARECAREHGFGDCEVAINAADDAESGSIYLTLQLQFSPEMSLARVGLMGPAPRRPCKDIGVRDAPLSELDSDAADFLDRPADQERCLVRRRGVFLSAGSALARWRMTAIMAKASMTSETWRCQPCQERVSL